MAEDKSLRQVLDEADERTEDEREDVTAVQLMAQIASQNARDLAFTTNALLDSLNHDVQEASAAGLEALDILYQATGGRMTPGEHARAQALDWKLNLLSQAAESRKPMSGGTA